MTEDWQDYVYGYGMGIGLTGYQIRAIVQTIAVCMIHEGIEPTNQEIRTMCDVTKENS